MSLINIPLSVSLAVASQSTPTSGIITAVWAGLVAAILGGSQFNITGPTGALAGILANYALLFGADILPLLSITSSLVVAAVYLFKWDKYMVIDRLCRTAPSYCSSVPFSHLNFCVVGMPRWKCQRYLPSSIVHGFTLGVAVIIASSQLSSALGIRDAAVRGSCFLNIVATLSRIGSSNVWAVAVFVFLWLTLFALIKVQPRMPWSVLIAAAGIAWGSAHNTQCTIESQHAHHIRLTSPDLACSWRSVLVVCCEQLHFILGLSATSSNTGRQVRHPASHPVVTNRFLINAASLDRYSRPRLPRLRLHCLRSRAGVADIWEAGR